MTGQQDENTSDPTKDLYMKVAEYAPGIIDFMNANPDNIFSRILSLLIGVWFHDGQAEFPPVDPALEPMLAQKADRKIDANYAAQAYHDALMDNSGVPPQQITVRYAGSNQGVVLTRKEFMDDSGTGFKGAIYQDANGHSIVFYGGMDIMSGVDFNDVEAIVQSRLKKHGINQQTGPAQELYEHAVRDSSSVEIVGYSLGAMLANDMAARLNAKATNLADIGLPPLYNTDGKSMYTDEHFRHIRENVISLRMNNDPYFGKAGIVYGQTTVLPSVAGTEVVAALGDSATRPAAFNAHSSMVAHHPAAYILASSKLHTDETVTGGGGVAPPAPATTVAARTTP